MRSKVETATNLMVILVAGFLLLGPDGLATRVLSKWQLSAHEKALAEEHWTELVRGAPLSGNPEGSVIAVEFMDYQCSYCRKMHELRSGWESVDQSAAAIRHFPLQRIHPNAELAARISICGESEPQEWQKIHSLLFEISDSLGSIDWPGTLRAAGVSHVQEIERCISAEKTTSRLDEDRKLARTMTVRGTPVYIFPDRIERGVISEQEYTAGT